MNSCFRKLLLFTCLFKDFKTGEYLFPNLWLANCSETSVRKTGLGWKGYFRSFSSNPCAIGRHIPIGQVAQGTSSLALIISH